MSYLSRGHTRRVGIDSKANGAGRRHAMDVFARMYEEAAA